MEWKNVTIKEKRAQEYYRKKIYRVFFLTCSEQLQIRLKAIYVEEIIKINRFPFVLRQLKAFNSILREKSLKILQKTTIKKLFTRLKA